MAMQQSHFYETFRALHERAGAFIMPNPWDGVSALLCKEAGFEAVGSSSAAIAFALGRRDGERAVTREAHMENAALIGRLSGLPVNGDTEDGFGPAPADAVDTVEAAIAVGLAGVAIEDTTADRAAPIHPYDDAVARVRAAASAARGRIVLTARTDNLQFRAGGFDETIRRLTAFAEAGADVLYAPGLKDMDAIRAVVAAVAPKPVNVVVGPASAPVPFAELEAAGVKRISLGAAPYRVAMTALASALERVAAGDLAAVAGGLTYRDMMKLVGG